MTLTLAPETEARLLAVATERNIAPEAVIDAAIEALLSPAPMRSQTLEAAAVQDTPEQARMRSALQDVIAEGQALAPLPRQEGPDQSPEERMLGEILTEKYRRQGFHLP